MRTLISEEGIPRLSTSHASPEPVDGEAIIVPRRVVVGSLDVAACRGRFGIPVVLGHQFVGSVESVAGAPKHDLVGRRVVGAIHAVCGRCDMCRKGLRTHCREQTILGLRGRHGCLADCFALPADNLVAVPDSLEDDHAVFAAPVASALQAFRQLNVQSKPYITVLGDGPLGLLTAQVMARHNVSVRLVGRHREKLARCERWGIKNRHAEDIGRRADQDVVVDCTGDAVGLELALELVRPRGTILLKSLHEAAVSGAVDLAPLVLKEIALMGSFSGAISEAITVLDRREVDVIGLIGRRMRLDEGGAIMHAAASVGALPVLVEI